jgi:peptide chain release factor 2
LFEKKKFRDELKIIDKSLENQENWTDHTKTGKYLKKRNYIQSFLNLFDDNCSSFSDMKELIKLSQNEKNEELFMELKKELESLGSSLNSQYIETLMVGKADSKNVILEINSGAGGVESQDWVAMLYRMYSRWAEHSGHKVTIIDQHIGEEAGFKSISIRIEGENCYGWLKLENGVHRLVRISPFDSQSRRHTSFASVYCYPEIDNTIEIDVNEKELKIDTFRASGAGGQHVNKTDSAVRITHIPTKIVVQCQSSRSQHRNKTIALDLLKSKLFELQITKEEEENKKNRSEKGDISWGNQIRSYIMQPYTMVKDHRTKFEISGVNNVLDGKIDNILENQLIKLI